MSEENDKLSWYAVRTRSKHEFKVRDQLTEQGIEIFLPTVEKWRKWSDRRKLIKFPLFSGYCFSRLFLRDRLSILKLRGVIEILGDPSGAIPIPEEEIEGVRRIVTSNIPHDPHPLLEKGMTVEVIHGPLTGLRGTLTRKGTHTRFIIFVNLLGQGVSVELSGDDIIPLEE